MRTLFVVLSTCLVSLATAVQIAAQPAMQLDYPHSITNSVDCTDCHFGPAVDFLRPEWKTDPPAHLDDKPFNNFCWSCHNGGPAAYVNTHSSYAIGTQRYGEWSIECRTCHWPHHLVQYRTNGAASYIASGTSSAVSPNSLTVAGSPWTENQLQGMILIPDLGKDLFNYKIASNTANTITVTENIDTIEITDGKPFAVVYGKLIKATISTPNSGNKEVMFFNNNGTNSFADGDSTYNGPCEVCHTQTNHFRNDGSAPEQNHENIAGGKQGSNCVGECHLHKNGFAHGQGSGGDSCGDAESCHGLQKSHPTHVGPVVNVGCNGCHDTTSFPKFRDGQDLANTQVCDNCHSVDGAAIAKTYFPIKADPDPTAGTWFADATNGGIVGYCGSCHNGASPGNSAFDGSGNPAPNIFGDNSTYGFYVNGHGKTGANFKKLTWQKSSGVGNPPAGRDCIDCHDLASQHFNNPVSRLKSGFENDANNSNCNQCHVPNGNPVAAVSAPYFYTDYAAYQNSAHSTERCTNCHEVHGGSGPYEAMTKGDRQSLCYQCHKDPADGGIQNDALANNRAGGHSSADDIEEAFAKTEKHDLGTQFIVGGKTYKLECTSCHNVHIVTGKYWDAEQNKSPVTRFPGNTAGYPATEVWGDDAGEKMDAFAALGSGTGGWYVSTARGGVMAPDQPAVYRPPRNGSQFEFDGSVLPDYATFCLDCHSSKISEAIYPINWGQGIPCNDLPSANQRVICEPPHGLAAANAPAYISDQGEGGAWGANSNPDPIFKVDFATKGRGNGHFMQWPYDSAERRAGINFVLSCTDCHEAHGSNRSAMIRERFNVTTNGDCGVGANADPDGENCGDGSNWKNFCTGCHYVTGGQHPSQAQCGEATCHTSNSIHRIREVMGSPNTQLQITKASQIGLYQRPAFTPDILEVNGEVGSPLLTVIFKTGVWGNSELNASITDLNTFVLTDVNGDNPRDIVNVSHSAGQNTATVTMSAPLAAVDASNDLIGLRGNAVWAWYEGGYVNQGTGLTIQAGAVPAGPWPAAIQVLISDADGDGIPDSSDNCISVSNPNQADGDGDTVGDACDNCPTTANIDQAETEIPADGVGDACDICATGDDSVDTDGDTVPDGCDVCPGDDRVDTDGDTVPNDCDNCIEVANTNQRDTDNDGYGNMCDADLNNNNSVNLQDLGLFKSVYGTSNPDADFNGNGSVNLQDLGIFKSLYGKPPGPRGPYELYAP